MSLRMGIKKKTQGGQKKANKQCDISIFNVFIAEDRSTPEHKCDGRDSRKEEKKKEKRYQLSNLHPILSWCPHHLRAKEMAEGTGR